MLYVAAGVFAIMVLAACGGLVAFYMKLSRPPTFRTMPIPSPGGTMGASQLQLDMKSSMGPRDAVTVRTELVEALSRAEELKLELDSLMSKTGATNQTGLSFPA